jgi:DNA processing protein
MVTTSELRLTDRQLMDLMLPLNPVDEGEHLDSAIERFAWLVWSAVCEPGDSFAGLLVQTLGAAEVLVGELEQVSPVEYRSKLVEGGVDPDVLNLKGDFAEVLTQSRQRWQPRINFGAVAEVIEDATSAGISFIGQNSGGWPNALRGLDRHQPMGLWFRGKPEVLQELDSSISIVGSRVSTPYGEWATDDLVAGIVQAGYATVSGGAYGIDARAHKATLASAGTTVSIMAGGLARLYPSGHKQLFEEIASTGLLLAELPPKAEPTKWRFLQRNRLIAALGMATVLIEAAPRSGALSTAARAVQLEKPVGAVPGPINAASSQGCHELIKAGQAELVTNANDVVRLAAGLGLAFEEQSQTRGALETRALDALGFGSKTAAQIRTKAGLTESEVQLALSSLALDGLIGNVEGKWKRLATRV